MGDKAGRDEQLQTAQALVRDAIEKLDTARTQLTLSEGLCGPDDPVLINANLQYERASQALISAVEAYAKLL
jgi:hypothetical protein